MRLILKDVGVLLQTLYLMATDMGLGGCAIGTTNIDLFERMTGIEFHVEGPVGQFALGRGAKSAASTHDLTNLTRAESIAISRGSGLYQFQRWLFGSEGLRGVVRSK